MYSNIKSVQYLVAGLKEYGICDIVVSPGNSHNAIVRSIEEDGCFSIYSIVDERSAAFFACGIAQERNRPVAICCTAGTATINYLSATAEAFRRNLPLVVITADKNPYYLGQNEDQMIDQQSEFMPVTKYSCRLPMIQSEKDCWYCQRIINEAFLEVNHHGTGPIHIDVPIEEGMHAIDNYFTTETLPMFHKISRYCTSDGQVDWESIFNTLLFKKVLIFSGQDINPSKHKIELLEEVVSKYNAVVLVDKLSNVHGKGIIEGSRASKLFQRRYSEICPDVIITIDGNITDYKFPLKANSITAEHWHVSTDGMIRDPFKKLSAVFEGTSIEFLDRMIQFGNQTDGSYYDSWKQANEAFKIPVFEYSNAYAINELMKRIPAGANLNIGNSSPIRLAQFFDLDPNVKVFCNRGVNGIDGCVSTFIGQAAASQSKLNYLIVGDLTFFYDLNSLWNRYVGNNVRIMLSNNGGAALFHFGQGLTKYPRLNENVAAEHFASAKAWVESQGFVYLCSHNKEEFDVALEIFMKPKSDKPVFFEVFTEKERDAEIQHLFYDMNTLPPKEQPEGKETTWKEPLRNRTKQAIKVLLGDELVNRIKGRKG